MTATTVSQEAVEVTQADIGWATSAAQHLCSPQDRDAAIRLLAQAFARHRQQAERAFEERERKLRGQLTFIQQSHDWMYGEKQRLENALKDIASRAHANLAQALKETPDAQ